MVGVVVEAGERRGALNDGFGATTDVSAITDATISNYETISDTPNGSNKTSSWRNHLKHDKLQEGGHG